METFFEQIDDPFHKLADRQGARSIAGDLSGGLQLQCTALGFIEQPVAFDRDGNSARSHGQNADFLAAEFGGPSGRGGEKPYR